MFHCTAENVCVGDYRGPFLLNVQPGVEISNRRGSVGSMFHCTAENVCGGDYRGPFLLNVQPGVEISNRRGSDESVFHCTVKNECEGLQGTIFPQFSTLS
jgi:hypothetical protein